MELVDMKLKEKSKDTSLQVVGEYKGPKYPYGLQLRFEKEEVEKIPSLTEYSVGERVLIQGEAVVTEVRMSEQQGGEKRYTVEMQIEKVSCEPVIDKPVSHMSQKEYRRMRESQSPELSIQKHQIMTL